MSLLTKFEYCDKCIHGPEDGINYCYNCNGSSFRKAPFERGTEVRAKTVLMHGDWKTTAAHAHRYPMIEKGTTVKLISYFSNFYGIYARIEGPNGNNYDVEPDKLEEIT